MKAALTIDHRDAVPKYQSVPQIGGVDAAQLLVNSNSGTIQAVRYIIGVDSMLDETVAAQRLANHTGDVKTLLPGADPIHGIQVDLSGADGEITDVYALPVADSGTDAGSDGIVDSSSVKNVNGQLATTVGTVATASATPAQLLAATNIIHWTFPSASKVREARLSVSNAFSTSTKAYLTLGGKSYA